MCYCVSASAGRNYDSDSIGRGRAMSNLKICVMVLALLVSVSSLTGCGMIKANVSAFSTLPLSGALKSIHVMSATDSADSSLEWAAYKKIFEQAFEEKDYVIAPDEKSADYVAIIEYDLVGAGRDTTAMLIGDMVHTTSHGVYRRTVFMEILSGDDMGVVYEGRVVSEGKCGALPEVMHELVEALFRKFPRGSGKVTVHFADFDC